VYVCGGVETGHKVLISSLLCNRIINGTELNLYRL
jgi:hypothetical protein